MDRRTGIAALTALLCVWSSPPAAAQMRDQGAGGGQVGRLTAVGTTTTHVSTFISDSNFRVPGGSYPGAPATTNAASARGISVGLVLRP